MIGQSLVFLETLQLVKKTARCDAPVLIEGETGTGKELVARAIHYDSDRHEYPFIPINCGAIPDDLIENELFGHKRGAFTGAQADNPGLISQAQHGTLFFDEVDSLSLKAQVTLLRFLQDQLYRPLGGGEPCSANVRIIVACNADLAKLVEQNLFRQDLLFRLKIVYLKLPPLRDRRGDAALLAAHFLKECVAKYDRGEKVLHPETIRWLDQYKWPGNIRELENLISREYLFEDGDVIHIASSTHSQSERRNGIDRRHANLNHLDFNKAKSQVIDDFEKCYLTEALTKASGNVTKAAKLVGKERRAFGKLLKKHGVDKHLYSE